MADKKATASAAKKAEEINVDVNKVKGTGASGNVTVEDVADAAANSEAFIVPATYRVSPNDALGGASVSIDGKLYEGSSVVSQEEYDRIKGAKGPVSYEYTNGIPLIQGRKVS